MTGLQAIPDLTACPRCDKAPLTESKDGLCCSGCKTEFPSVGGIPWLFAEPTASLGDWRNRLHFALQKIARESQQIERELDDANLSELTRQRLEQQREAADSHRNRLRDVLAPLDIHTSPASYESYLALRTRLPTDQGIATYYANIHRDWAWGDAENQASIDVIQEVAGASDYGRVLVLGAGAGRLAYDMHMGTDAACTVALDFNPLLVLVASEVTRGRTLELHEFPLAPKSLDDIAPLRSLAAPEPVREGFQLVLADALRPPFAGQSFDTVVTPWIVDIVEEDFAIQAARINNLLAEDGRWINFGSLAFRHASRQRCYSREESLAIVETHGFDIAGAVDREIPYMCSPASRHARRETVFAFAATKTGKVKPPPRHKSLPDWLVTGKEPVPLTPSFQSQAMATRIHAYIMSMIDGKRSMLEMAEILEQQQLLSRDEALPALRNFLTKMHDDAGRDAG
jgi:uncharacterized protein YbaR (Trm112 family)